MKNRNILYGYCYKDGIITVHEGEAKIVKGVCKDYLDGKSLLDIANGLNERQIEYMPGVMGWNKARIMRMLEDIRYIGDERYPPIIEQETYDAIRKLKDSKNGQKAIDSRQCSRFFNESTVNTLLDDLFFQKKLLFLIKLYFGIHAHKAVHRGLNIFQGSRFIGKHSITIAVFYRGDLA